MYHTVVVKQLRFFISVTLFTASLSSMISSRSLMKFCVLYCQIYDRLVHLGTHRNFEINNVTTNILFPLATDIWCKTNTPYSASVTKNNSQDLSIYLSVYLSIYLLPAVCCSEIYFSTSFDDFVALKRNVAQIIRNTDLLESFLFE